MNDSDLIFGLMSAHDKKEFTFSDFVYLTLPFNVSETSLRTNLSRMSKKGLIYSRREGKNGFYSFTDKGNKIKDNVSNSFLSLKWNNWNNMWWGIFFSVPEIKKEDRYKIRNKLTAYRFVSLFPGFWIRPINEKENMEKKLKNIFDDKHCKVINFKGYKEFSKEEISTLWNLDAINRDFKNGLEIINKNSKLFDTMSPIEIFKKRMTIGETIINILFKDPLLPDSFLTKDWKANELKIAFQNWDKQTKELSKPFWEKIYY